MKVRKNSGKWETVTLTRRLGGLEQCSPRSPVLTHKLFQDVWQCFAQ